MTSVEYYNSVSENPANAYWLLSSPNVRNAVEASEVRDANGTPAARMEMFYDDPAATANLIESKVWASTKGMRTDPLNSSNSISTAAQYDQYGNPILTTDAKGVQTHITYGSINGHSGLYPTQTVAAYGTSVARSSVAVYDFYTGLVTTAIDVDNGVTSATEYDALGRPIKVRSAAGTSLESWTRTEYNDAERRVIVRTDLETIGDGRKVAIQHYDQLGRVRLSRTLENPATEDPTNETHGIKVETRYQTGNPNSYQLTSNPFRAAYATQATNEPTMGWTRSKSWNTGRKQQIESFSGAALPAPWGTNANSTGIATTDIDANATTVTDQAGKQRRSIENGLGQLIRVDEPDKNTGQLGTVVSPIQPTNYSYNTLGKMVQVQQGVQNRFFLYDSLGRILRVRQPEQDVNAGLNTLGNPGNNSWTAGLTYDNNGNVLTATDAKGTTITNTYDALNRALTRTYSDGTPAVTYSYDGVGLSPVPQFSKGKLTKVTSSVSESRYTEFDPAGRLKQYQQITDGQTYTSSYQYNLSGALVEETYPSGRKVRNEFETDGQLSKVDSMKGGTTLYKPVVSSMAYNAAGMISQMKYGNGRWETSKFNSRLQMTEIGAGTSAANTSLWKTGFEYGELQANGTVDGIKNSGNIAKQTLTVPGTSFVQSYKYDPIHRLTEAVEKTGTTQNWIQNFDYDRYGNRTSFSQNIGGITNSTTPTVDANTNRFNSGQGFSYDKNGNIVNDIDEAGSLPRQFIFNGDNKQIEVKRDGVTIARYFYDGEGKRIKKVTDTETTIFVYSGGKLVAEYSTQISQTPSTSYLTKDHLGSPRVVTNELGQVKARRDFMPFGEELYGNVGARTSALQYGSSEDDVRQKFTGYPKDQETGLDFAEARMYQNRHGRFTAIDPLLASGKSSDPQSFNRYIYVMNDPIKFVDPNGLCSVPSGLKKGQVGICVEAFIATKSVGLGGLGRGDNRGFNGNNRILSARVMVTAIVSTDTEKVYAEWNTKVWPSEVKAEVTLTENGRIDLPDGSRYSSTVGVGTSLPGSADGNVEISNVQKVVGEQDFGNGVDVTVSIANGLNGAQVSPNPLIRAGAPGGSIDGSVTFQISGNGNVKGVSAEGRPFPSYAAYSYTVGADGKTIITKRHVEERETPPVENLEKPVQPFKIIQ
ncbi:MAG: RHS repeat-associated core domain-containing protein [Pyrinomonadaceae bacterium]